MSEKDKYGSHQHYQSCKDLTLQLGIRKSIFLRQQGYQEAQHEHTIESLRML